MSLADLLTSTSFWTSIIIIFALIYQWWKKPHPNFPPLIRGIPVLGVLPYLDNYPQKIFKKWSMDMKEPVIGVRMGTSDAVIINTHDAAMQILSKQNQKVGGRPSLLTYDYPEKNGGIIFTDFSEAHKILRRFSLRYLKKGFDTEDGSGAGMEMVLNEEADRLINELKKFPGQPIDLKTYVFRFTLNVTSKIVADKHYEYDDPELIELFKRISYIISESDDASKVVLINIFPSLRFFPPFRQVVTKSRKCMDLICDDFVQPLIKEHKANFNPDKIKDLIDEYLLEQRDDEKNFSDKALIYLVRDFYMAGTDTTSCSVAWVFLCYLHFTQYHEKLNEEIKEVLGSDEIIFYDLAKEMPFTSAFLQEVMRFRSTISMSYRKSTDTINFRSYIIPKGTRVLLNNLGIHKDPDAWADPEKFDPHRHLDEDGSFVPSSKMIPYGMGYRICIGENLARREIFVLFTKFLQAFHVSADVKTLPTLDYGYNNLLHSPLPYLVTLNPRSSPK